MNHSKNRELWMAFLAIVAISLLYGFILLTWQHIPAASSLFGHGLGLAGFILMLMTEILYSLRKRSRSASWGRMSHWLEFHIFTGLVGPYMVLLHSSWKYNGLAGVVTLLMLIVVASGFVGRYIYTAVPRSADGAELEANELNAEIQRLHTDIARATSGQANQAWQAQAIKAGQGGWFGWLGWQIALRRLPVGLRPQAARLNELAHRSQALERQMQSLALARRMLAVWHAVHIPIGLALFSSAFVHATAAFYYASLLR